MKIQFEQLPISHLERFNGGEKELAARIFSDGKNKILKGCLVSGAGIGYHRHTDSSEIIFVLSGEGKMLLNGEDTGIENASVEYLRAGDCHYCPKGFYHSFLNESEEDLVFYAVVPIQ